MWPALFVRCLTLFSFASAPLLAQEDKVIDTGQASFYAFEFAGQRTASGEPYRPGALTAAHRSVAFGRRLMVTNLTNGRQVIVRVNDRGPHICSRIIDLSFAAAMAIGLHKSGTAQVRLTLLP